MTEEPWEAPLVKDMKQALSVAAKFGIEKTAVSVHFEGRKYKGVHLQNWEKRS